MNMFGVPKYTVNIHQWTGLDCLDHRRAPLTAFFASFGRLHCSPIVTSWWFFIFIFWLVFFSKKQCEHMPSSFRVNNLLHQNLLNYSIFLDLKTTKKSKLNFPVSMTGTSLNSFGRCNQSSLLLQIVSWSSCSLIAKDCLALSQDCLSCDNNLSPLSFFPYKTHPFVQGFLHELPRFLVFYPMNTLTLLVLRMGGIFPWKNLQEMAIATSRWQTLTWNCISSRCC
jgi:hypothetical protein